MSAGGGRFDFDDGGTYCGGWEDGKTHGHGVCTGPKNSGEYCGSWNHGYEVTGCYTWPSGNTYEGNWQKGKRSGLGIEAKGRWTYKGEWTSGFKGRYGIRSSLTSRAKYEGTWENGLQDGYGTETYADGGIFQGQWMGGLRHGYGVRQSVPYGLAAVVNNELRATSMSSINTDKSMSNAGERLTGQDLNHIGARGGFVLSVGMEREEGARSRSDQFRDADSVSEYHFRDDASAISGETRKKGFFRSGKIKRAITGLTKKKDRSSAASSISGASRVSSAHSLRSRNSYGSLRSSANSSTYSASFYDGDCNGIDVAGETEIDDTTQEFYYGEWKNDKRNGAGVCERSDGYKYEGQWLNNRRHGYGCTTFNDGRKEEGKYKHNYFIKQKKKTIISIRSGKSKEKIENSLKAALKSSEISKKKAEIAQCRTNHAIGKAYQADEAAELARDESKIARCVAKEMSPDYHQPGIDYIRNARGNTYNGEYDANQGGDFAQGDDNKVHGDLTGNLLAFRQEDEDDGSDIDNVRNDPYAIVNTKKQRSNNSIGRSQNSYVSLNKSDSSMTRSQRSVSNPPLQQDFGDEDPDHWITKYEQEMSTLQPRETEKIVQNDAIPDVAILPGSFSNQKEAKATRKRAGIVASPTASSMDNSEKVLDDLDMSSSTYVPRFQSKKIEFNDNVPVKVEAQESEWTRYAIFALLILLNLGFLVLFSHLS